MEFQELVNEYFDQKLDKGAVACDKLIQVEDNQHEPYWQVLLETSREGRWLADEKVTRVTTPCIENSWSSFEIG